MQVVLNIKNHDNTNMLEFIASKLDEYGLKWNSGGKITADNLTQYATGKFINIWDDGTVTHGSREHKVTVFDCKMDNLLELDKLLVNAGYVSQMKVYTVNPKEYEMLGLINQYNQLKDQRDEAKRKLEDAKALHNDLNNRLDDLMHTITYNIQQGGN